MAEPGLDDRRRERDVEISRKYGATPIRTLRRIYGQSFALGFDASVELKDLLAASGEKALSQRHRNPLYEDHDAGILELHIQRQGG
jgi:hypothetical protein